LDGRIRYMSITSKGWALLKEYIDIYKVNPMWQA